jgi:hypothetical protein
MSFLVTFLALTVLFRNLKAFFKIFKNQISDEKMF